MTDRPPIAVNLRAFRDEAGCSWRELAAAVGVSERQVYEWARVDGAEYVASWDTCVKLAAFFAERLDRPVEAGDFYTPPEVVA